MTLGGFSWRGGTREYPHRQDDGREQSEEPPAERWERREWEQQADVTLGCEPDRCPDCNWPFNVVDPEVVEE